MFRYVVVCWVIMCSTCGSGHFVIGGIEEKDEENIVLGSTYEPLLSNWVYM